MDIYSDLLKQHGLKVTIQRVAIMKYLMGTLSHPTADTIFNDLIRCNPSMSLATVYKTLDTLRNEGLILELNTGEDSNRYDGNVRPHSHFRCLRCNSIIDIKLPQSHHEQINKEVSITYNVDVLERKCFFFGYCQDCGGGNSTQSLYNNNFKSH